MFDDIDFHEGVVMVLINAIYFKALWEQPLTDKSLMKDRDFNLTADRSVKVEYMRSHSPYRVGKIPGVNARILELNYKGGEVSNTQAERQSLWQ